MAGYVTNNGTIRFRDLDNNLIKTVTHYDIRFEEGATSAGSGYDSYYDWTFPAVPTPPPGMVAVGWRISDEIILTGDSKMNYTVNLGYGYVTLSATGGNTGDYVSQHILWALAALVASGGHPLRRVDLMPEYADAYYNLKYTELKGSNNSANPTSWPVGAKAVLQPLASVTGYAFYKWQRYSGSNNYNIDFDGDGLQYIPAFFTTVDINIRALWNLLAYTVSYTLNGGTNSGSNPGTYTIESALIVLANPTRTNYTFGGWYSNAGLTTPASTIPAGSNGNKTFYAKWTPTSFTISYTLNSGTNHGDNPATYDVETAVALSDPTRANYTFAGWYTEAAFTNQTTGITVGNSGPRSFYAKWTPVNFNITYNLDGGTNGVGNPATYNIETPTITLNSPSKTGYTFGGWFSEAAFTNQVTTIATGSSGAKTLYAKWTLNTYTIGYNLDGGVNSGSNPASYTVTTDKITLANPTKNGYTFQGWFTEIAYTNQVTEIAKGSTGNKTFYAKWQINNYTVSYVMDGGTNNAGNITTFTITTATFSLLAPTRTGYGFFGWFTEAGFINQVTNIPNGSTGNKTFYAKWTKDTYSISYVLNDGVNAGGNPATYTVTDATITLLSATRTGYAFGGWYTEASLINQISTIANGSTGNKTLYAKWTVVEYNINYTMGSGTNHGSNPAKYTIESATITFQTPTKVGYNFVGWFTAASGGSVFNAIPAGSIGVKNVYARWLIRSGEVILRNRYVQANGAVTDTEVARKTVNYNAAIQFGGLTPSTLTKTKGAIYDYVFMGWTTNVANTNDDTFIAAEYVWNKNTGNYLTGIGNMDADLVKARTYYAVWKRYKRGMRMTGKALTIRFGSGKIKKVNRGTVTIWEDIE